MKRLFWILIATLISFPVFAEMINVETSRGPVELVVPDDEAALRAAYEDMAKLYLEERFDHEGTIENLEALGREYQKLFDAYTATNVQANRLAEAYREETSSEWWSNQVVAGGGYEVESPFGGYTVSLAYQGVLKERLIVGAGVGVPLRAELRIGWAF